MFLATRNNESTKKIKISYSSQEANIHAIQKLKVTSPSHIL